MPTTLVDGITTHYEVVGSGPPLLMFSPGGFNATLENWRSMSIYSQLKPLDVLAEKYTCVVFDRRESGLSGGRVERVTWDDYVAQGKGLLDHLGIERAHLMGGCLGCSPALALAVRHPEVVRSMILFWPAGGPKYRITGHARFAHHLGYARENGLSAVAALAASHDQPFTKDPQVGPWAPVLRTDPAFAEAFAGLDLDRYQLLVASMARTLLDRDTVAGAEPEDLLRLDIPTLVVPGDDESHARSAARYLEECLPLGKYWDIPVVEQTAGTVPPRLLEFLDRVPAD